MTLRRVAAGEIIAVPCADFGVSMRPAPEAGVVFEDGDRRVFVPATKLDEARKLLGGKR